MRYAVTGAAGFIGSHLAETLVAGGHEVVGIDCFTDYYDPALKEENAARARRPAPRPGRGRARLRRLRRRLPPRGAAGRAQLRRRLRALPAPQRARLAARVRGRRARRREVVFASSSSVYGAAERYPTPEDTPPRPLSPYGITKLACEHLADAYARSFGLDCVVLRYFNAFGPRQRPDMAFTRIVVRARRGLDLRALRRRRPVARLDVRLRHRRRDDPGDGGREPGPTTSAARSRRR